MYSSSSRSRPGLWWGTSASTRALSVITAALISSGAPLWGQDPVFVGDPIDPSTGTPYTILPGVPLVYPGPDEHYATDDDIIDIDIIGDVDVVIRVGDTFAGGAIPPPAAGIPAAAVVVAGGIHTGVGTEVPFQVILSDGSSPPAAGNPLSGPELDGRGVLVVAYPDLDGDGFIGPTATDGDADNEIERQEVLTVVGRQVGVIENGVASGSVGVSLGAPASSGGLGLVLVGGVLTGVTPPTYLDGPWIASVLPFMPPIDPTEIIIDDDEEFPPDPEQRVEIELEIDKLFTPAPNHPLLGTPYAIPTDGSSVTVDLVRSESGIAVGAGLARRVNPTSFVADPARRLLPAVGVQGAREVVETVVALALADDGPGNPQTVVVFASDLLGNPTDPRALMDVTLEVGPALHIVAPNTDNDLQRETVTLDSAAIVSVVLDDAGGPNDGGIGNRISAIVDDVITASLNIDLVPGMEASPIPTATGTPGATLTATPAATATSRPTLTATSAPTLTATPVATETSGPTLTATPVATPTSAPTLTATPVATETSGPTLTATSAPTLTAAPSVSATPSPTLPALCVGDCNRNGFVSVEELVLAINIALGLHALDECSALDHDSDDSAAIHEVIAAVGAGLNGCLVN